jgi:hypothetical protein
VDEAFLFRIVVTLRHTFKKLVRKRWQFCTALERNAASVAPRRLLFVDVPRCYKIVSKI